MRRIYAVDTLQRASNSTALTISVVSEMELTVGCRDKEELAALALFLERFDIIHLRPAISRKAVSLLQEFRLSHGLLIADAFIAATAIIEEVPFISKNQRDYRFIDELKLLPYPGPLS